MAIYEVQSPDGKLFEIEAPSPAAAHEALRARFAPRETQSPAAVAGNVGMGMVRGARDVIDGGAQLLAHGAEQGAAGINQLAAQNDWHGIAPATSWFAKYMTGQRELVDKINKEAETDFQKNWGGGQPGSDAGRLIGNAALTAPAAMVMPGAAAPGLGARVLSGAASGAVTGALQPTDIPADQYWDKKGEQAGVGAVGGAVAPVVIGGVARMVSPRTDPNAAALMAEGAQLTPGMLLGKTANRLEQGMTSIPFVGDVIKARRGEAMESFNRVAIDRVLEPLGLRLPANIPMGREAVAHAHRAVTDAYDQLLPQLTIRADPTLANNIVQLMGNASHLEPGLETTFRNIVRDKVFRHFSPSGGMTGQAFKETESEIGRLARDYSTSSVASERQLGGALQQMQAEMRQLLERSNPGHAQELRAINSAYADLLRVQGAAAKTGARGENEMGVFTPAQLNQSVRTLDPSMRKGSFARGEARMQDLGDRARMVLDQTVPDSGTPYRAYATLPALLAASHADPTGLSVLPAYAAAGLGANYTPPMRAAWEYALARRPAVAPHLANIVRSPAVTPLAAILAQSERQ